MRKILITGADGQLGRELNHALKLDTSVQLLNTDVTNALGEVNTSIIPMDITNKEQVNAVMNQFRPDVVINCAAFTAVDLCESQQERAHIINSEGPGILAECAQELDAVMVHISTDYVFDGLSKEPYTEESKTNPQSIYGITKLQGELQVMSKCRKHFIIRTAWLYGDGKNFLNTMLRLAKEQPEIRVVEDQIGSPTSAKELVKMLLYLINTENYGIYHGTCEGSTSWYEFAKEIFLLSEQQVSVIPITTAEYKTAAKRPVYSVLCNKRWNELTDQPFLHWKAALADFMSIN